MHSHFGENLHVCLQLVYRRFQVAALQRLKIEVALALAVDWNLLNQLLLGLRLFSNLLNLRVDCRETDAEFSILVLLAWIQLASVSFPFGRVI